MLGHYDGLERQVAAVIPGSTLVEFADLGHAPHIQAPDRFHEALMDGLVNKGLILIDFFFSFYDNHIVWNWERLE